MADALSPREYRALVERSPALLWRAGLDARCDYFNGTWLAFTGRTLAQEQGDGWAEGVHPDDVARCVELRRDHFRRRQAFELEYRLRRHDGVHRWILDRGAPYLDERGVLQGFLGSCVDVEERRRAQDEEDRVADELERWILGTFGHDIRGPLTTISYAAQVAERSATDPAAVASCAQRIRRGAGRIKDLVDDLLDMTRVKQGGIPRRAP